MRRQLTRNRWDLLTSAFQRLIDTIPKDTPWRGAIGMIRQVAEGSDDITDAEQLLAACDHLVLHLKRKETP